MIYPKKRILFLGPTKKKKHQNNKYIKTQYIDRWSNRQDPKIITVIPKENTFCGLLP